MMMSLVVIPNSTPKSDQGGNGGHNGPESLRVAEIDPATFAVAGGATEFAIAIGLQKVDFYLVAGIMLTLISLAGDRALTCRQIWSSSHSLC